MSAGQMPSDPNFWDSNYRKIVFGLGGGAVGGNQIYHQRKESQYKDKMLAYERAKGLNKGTLNPYQYIQRATDDGICPRQMKEELSAWGEKWKGTNFANPEAFDVTETWRPREELGAKLLGQKDRVCKLNKVRKESESEVFSSDGCFNSAATPEQKRKNVVQLGGRGGSTELREEIEGGQESLVWESFTCTSPQEIGPIPFYVFGILFAFTSTFLVNYVQHKFSKSANTTTKKNRTLGNPSGEEQELHESATPQFLLEIFKSYQNKTISKYKAVYILVNFYNLSEIEAVKLLDE